MVSIDATSFTQPMNLSLADISKTDTESLLDLAIDTLNLVGNLSIDNLTGAAGSKTATVTQKERAAILQVTRIAYYGWFHNINPQTAGDVAVSPVDLMDDPEALRAIKLYASMLQTRTFERT